MQMYKTSRWKDVKAIVKALGRELLNDGKPAGKSVLGAMLLIGLMGPETLAQVNLIRETYSQGFNSLNRSGSLNLDGTATEGTVVAIPVLPGWYAAKSGGSGTTDATMNADDGTQNGGRFYSYGTGDAVDRALGLKGSGTFSGAVGVAFVNALNQTITSVDISYFHEIWSVQGTSTGTASEDRLAFSYGLSGGGLTTENFLGSELMSPYAVLDAVSSPSLGLTNVTDGSDPLRARDGNTEAWRAEVSGVITGLEWQPGETLFLRWEDTNSGGYDAGHGIEDFKLEIGGSEVGQSDRYPHVGIKVDGDFSDWTHDENLYQDTTGDVTSDAGIDFATLGAAVSPEGLALYIKTVNPTVLSDSSLRIYLDIDGNAATGSAFGGLGAELMLDFTVPQSDRRFFPVEAVAYPEEVRLPAGEVIAEFLPNGLNAYETHPASTEFEMLIPLSVLRGIVPGGRLGVLLRDSVRDFAPDLGETFHVAVPRGLDPVTPMESVQKKDPGDIRIASYNVLVNGPYNPEKEAAFGRQLAATRPDIINFQELYQASATWAADFVGRWIPLEEGEWYARKNNDCITVSRFPIENTWFVDGNLVVQVDMDPVWGFDAVFVNAHTPAHVENQEPRISETTNLMLLLRRMLNGTEPGGPEGEFTVFFIGDLNANSPKIELSSPRTGIFYNDSYASLNYWPDAYNLPLVDSAPRHTHTSLPRLYTWRSLESGNTQRLDYIYYQQSRLTQVSSYVFDTGSMPADFRDFYSLEAEDSRASDHLLMIADYRKRQLPYAWESPDIALPGWFVSQWAGWAYATGDDFLYLPRHGYVYARPDPAGVWFWNPRLGWWFSHAAAYPFAYLGATGTWIYFELSPGEHPLYYDFSTGEWEE